MTTAFLILAAVALVSALLYLGLLLWAAIEDGREPAETGSRPARLNVPSGAGFTVPSYLPRTLAACAVSHSPPARRRPPARADRRRRRRRRATPASSGARHLGRHLRRARLQEPRRQRRRRSRPAACKTVYVETANDRSTVDVVNPSALGLFVDALKARGIRVVAWYLPGFVQAGAGRAPHAGDAGVPHPLGSRIRRRRARHRVAAASRAPACARAGCSR